MSKTNKAAGKTAEKKPLRAYILDAIKKYSSENPGEQKIARLLRNSTVAITFASMIALYCENLYTTFKSFGLTKIGGEA